MPICLPSTARPRAAIDRLVFLDESGVTTDLIRRDGRSPRGARLIDHALFGQWQTHTILVALRLAGLTAPVVFDGPLDNATFRAYVDHVFVPTLRPGRHRRPRQPA
jgi:hypothetical protein